MNAGVRLAALAAVFSVAALAGGAINPPHRVTTRHGSNDNHGNDHMSMTATSDHAGHSGTDAEPPGGLAIAERGYRLDLLQSQLPVGEPRVRFRVLDDHGAPVHDFEEEHGAKLHLILVRRDLTGYQHLHPTLGPDGTWSVRLTLPQPGAYRVYADFRTGREALTLGADLFAPGDFEPRPLPAQVDTASVDGYDVELSEQSDGMLHFAVSRGGDEVDDLQPYLGARGHLVALREGDLAYLHVHPEEGPTLGAGISFHAELPTAGRYRLFLQFKHGGRVHTVAFTREVTR